MKSGKAFELFVKRILIDIGFSEVKSDGLYVFDGAPGQMIQGLGEAHNADVLLEPPVQTPFFNKTRLLIECKDNDKKIGLDIVRSALGLREDINHFEIVDSNKLKERRRQRRSESINFYDRCTYQVAIASLNGYTKQAQEFAATHRIPLIEFNKLAFWDNLYSTLHEITINDQLNEEMQERKIIEYADEIGKKMAVAITNSGQMLFLHRDIGDLTTFSDQYRILWASPDLPWVLLSGDVKYSFQLPEYILKQWVKTIENDMELKRTAIYFKEEFLSNMIVYYRENGHPAIKMIAIDKNRLNEFKRQLKNR